MKNSTNAVTAVFSHDRIIIAFSVLLNERANVTKSSAWLNYVNTFIHAFLGEFTKAFSGNARLANKKHFTGIAMVVVLDYGDIDISTVTLFYFFFSWGTAADLVTYTGSYRFWKTVLI